MTIKTFSLPGGCFDRAIATMRLALGYKKALPESMKPKATRSHIDAIKELSKCFPGRLILVYIYDPAKVANDHRTDGIVFTNDAVVNLLNASSWLFAFAYWGNDVMSENDRPDCHFVVGCPVDLRGYLKIPFVIAVSLDI